MILDKQVLMKVNNRTAQKYKDKGYDVPTKIGVHGNIIFDTDKSFYVKVEDLEPTSTISVHIVCDICGEESIMQYRDYCKTLGENGLKTCTKCKYIKTKKNNMEKYGVQSTSQLDSVKEKIKKTNRERYGVDWYSSNKDWKQKVIKTNIEKYGCEWSTQSESVRYKTIQTNLQKYGVESPSQLKEFQDKAKNTMIERYGTNVSMHIPEIREKIEATNLERYGSKSTFGCSEIYSKGLETKYRNGTTATSRQQFYLCNLFNGTLNLPCSRYSLDIALEDIDIEYDGKGHQLSVDLGNISQHDFNVKQIVRDKIVKSNGYKIIRFISRTDRLPSDEILLHILKLSKNYFNSTSHTWIEWYFDENKFRNAENIEGSFFEFGKLRNIRKRTA